MNGVTYKKDPDHFEIILDLYGRKKEYSLHVMRKIEKALREMTLIAVEVGDYREADAYLELARDAFEALVDAKIDGKKEADLCTGQPEKMESL